MHKRTERQKQASRLNGAKSKGPITIDGREVACRNAIKHGFTSRMALLPIEDPVQLQHLTYLYLDRFQPRGDAEELLVMDIAAASWRVRRLIRAETALLEIEINRTTPRVDKEMSGIHVDHRVAAAIESLSQKKEMTLQLILRYLGRARRDYARAERELSVLKADRAKMPIEPEPPPNHDVTIDYHLPTWEEADGPRSPQPQPPLVTSQKLRPPGSPKAAA